LYGNIFAALPGLAPAKESRSSCTCRNFNRSTSPLAHPTPHPQQWLRDSQEAPSVRTTKLVPLILPLASPLTRHRRSATPTLLLPPDAPFHHNPAHLIPIELERATGRTQEEGPVNPRLVARQQFGVQGRHPLRRRRCLHRRHQQ
jgi:hypothetical protein